MPHVNFNKNEFSPLSKDIKTVMKEAIDLFAGANPVSFGSDNKMAAVTAESKYKISEVMNAESYDIFYTSGNLHSEIDIINWSILFLGVEIVITSVFEDGAKLNYLKYLSGEGKIKLYFLKTAEFGEIDLDDFKNIIKGNRRKVLISLSHANSYTGILLSVKDIAGLTKEYHGFLHLNSHLMIGKYEINLSRIKADFLTFDLSLCNGPVGIGVLMLNESMAIANNSYRSLVETIQSIENKNTSLIKGLATSLFKALDEILNKQKEISKLKSYFTSELETKQGLKTIEALLIKEGLINQLAFFVPKMNYGKYLIKRIPRGYASGYRGKFENLRFSAK